MQFFYDDKLPLRILDEGQFWKRQESEHTVVIRELAPDLEKPFVEALAIWEQAFNQTENLFIRLIETVTRSGKRVAPEVLKQIHDLVAFSLQQSQQFVLLLNQILTESEAIKKNKTAQVVIKHIIRESEYFIGIVGALLSKQLL